MFTFSRWRWTLCIFMLAYQAECKTLRHEAVTKINLRQDTSASVMKSSTGVSAHQIMSLDGHAVDASKVARITLVKGETQSHHLHLAHLKAKMQKLYDRSEVSHDKTSWLQVTEDKELGPLGSSVGLDIDDMPERHLATFFGTVKVGGQDFKVLFDTGSCELWITSKHCDEYSDASICNKHTQFDETLSSTYKEFDDDKVMSVTYLSGEIEGPLAYDTVALGSIVIPDQPLAVADTIKVPLLADVSWDGVLGLAYPNKELYNEGVVPVFDSMIERKMLDHNLISYYVNNKGGVITFGGVDKSLIDGDAAIISADVTNLLEVGSSVSTSKRHYRHVDSHNAGTFKFASVTNKGYWTVDIVDIELQYGDKEPVKTNVCSGQPNGRCPAIVDTGTYLTYGPKDMFVNSDLSKVTVSSCAEKASLPDVTFVLWAGENETPARVRLSPEDYTMHYSVPTMFAPTGHDCSDPSNSDSNLCDHDCVVGFSPDTQEDWTLGQSFLRSLYTVFDRDTDRVGFARANPNAKLE